MTEGARLKVVSTKKGRDWVKWRGEYYTEPEDRPRQTADEGGPNVIFFKD